MKPSTLAYIKQEMARLHKVAESYANLHPQSPEYVTCQVLIQNMAFSGVNCQGYTHEKAIEELNATSKCLATIAEYCGEQVHFIQFLSNEVSSIIDGNIFAEDIEEEELASHTQAYLEDIF